MSGFWEICLITLLSLHGYQRTASEPLLFDLLVDPNESSQIECSPINANYSDIYSDLVERSLYWADHVRVGVDVNQTNQPTVWMEANAVVPWITNDSFTPLNVTQLYNYSDAPNIVFVLVDDWGWNDIGYRSSYLSWTTPNIDRLAAQGVKLENYFTSYLCIPTRGALLTGRYPIRLGLSENDDAVELPLTETTLAQEMKSAGYRTYMVGKWHLGYSTVAHTPAERGFDSSYGYFNGFVDYWTKFYGNYLDLHDGNNVVTDAAETSADLHNGYLMQTKAEAAIADHAANHTDKPMFLYYAMQLIHGVWSAPDVFLDRCDAPTLVSDDDSAKNYLDYNTLNQTRNYCGLNVMLDEAIGNLTCALEKYGMANNTILVLVSDNGGQKTILGNSYPFVGAKGSYFRGGVSASGLVHSSLLPESVRGQEYVGQMHVTDWLPTLMGLATNNQWTGSLSGLDLDGVDQWSAITTLNSTSPRSEIVHYHNGSDLSSIQIDMVKLNLGDNLPEAETPYFHFPADLAPSLAASECANPSLMSEIVSSPVIMSAYFSSYTRRQILNEKVAVMFLGLVTFYIIIAYLRNDKRFARKDGGWAANDIDCGGCLADQDSDEFSDYSGTSPLIQQNLRYT